MKDLEHQMQAAYFLWSSANLQRFPELELLHATPNGGQRSITTAVKLKREGVKAGEPDVKLPVARGGFVGLAIEFKSRAGNPTNEQQRRIDLYQKNGWCAVLCWSLDAAIATTERYLSFLALHTYS